MQSLIISLVVNCCLCNTKKLNKEELLREFSKVYFIDIVNREAIRVESLKIKQKINKYNPKLVHYNFYWVNKQDNSFVHELNKEYKTSTIFGTQSGYFNYSEINNFNEKYKGVYKEFPLDGEYFYTSVFENPIQEVLDKSTRVCSYTKGFSYKEQTFYSRYYTQYNDYLIQNCTIYFVDKILENFLYNLEYDLNLKSYYLKNYNNKYLLNLTKKIILIIVLISLLIKFLKQKSFLMTNLFLM